MCVFITPLIGVRPHRYTPKAQLFSVGLFFWEILNGGAHLREQPLEFFAIKFGYSWIFTPNMPRFYSLFSVPLLTIQEVTFNEINDLRGVVCKLKLVGGSD